MKFSEPLIDRFLKPTIVMRNTFSEYINPLVPTNQDQPIDKKANPLVRVGLCEIIGKIIEKERVFLELSSNRTL